MIKKFYDTKDKEKGGADSDYIDTQNFDELCNRHLNHLHQPPFNGNIEHFLLTGTVNGSFTQALKKLCDEHADSRTAELKKEIEKYVGAVDAMMKVSEELMSLRSENLSLKERIKELEKAMTSVQNELGTVNFSNHTNMKAAINGALELTENTLVKSQQ